MLKTLATKILYRPKQYYAAICLFAHMDKAQVAYVGDEDPNISNLFYIRWRSEHRTGFVGSIRVSERLVSAQHWKSQLRYHRLADAYWQHDRPLWPAPGSKLPPINECQPLQLSAVYPAIARTPNDAAKEAWRLLTSCERNHTDWYDASPARRWSKLFGYDYTGPQPM
jgi:hypothetical protein